MGAGARDGEAHDGGLARRSGPHSLTFLALFLLAHFFRLGPLEPLGQRGLDIKFAPAQFLEQSFLDKLTLQVAYGAIHLVVIDLDFDHACNQLLIRAATTNIGAAGSVYGNSWINLYYLSSAATINNRIVDKW